MRPLPCSRETLEGGNFIYHKLPFLSFVRWFLLCPVQKTQYRLYSSNCTQGLGSADFCCRFKYGWSGGFQMKSPAPAHMETTGTCGETLTAPGVLSSHRFQPLTIQLWTQLFILISPQIAFYRAKFQDTRRGEITHLYPSLFPTHPDENRF